MGKVPKKPVQVSTPGSYSASKILKAKARAKTKGKSKGKSKAKSRTVQNTTPSKASKKKGKGRPSSASDRRPRKTIKARSSYTEVDLLEAVRLVVEEDFSISCAAQHLNDVKTGVVPRMTLSDRLKKEEPTVKPVLGRPQECYRTFILLYLYTTVPLHYLLYRGTFTLPPTDTYQPTVPTLRYLDPTIHIGNCYRTGIP